MQAQGERERERETNFEGRKPRNRQEGSEETTMDQKLETNGRQKRGLEEEACRGHGSIWAVTPY